MRSIYKRFLSIYLCAVMILFVFAGKVSFAAPDDPTITVSSPSGLPGQIVTVSISVDADSNIRGGTLEMMYDLVFDASFLTYVRCDNAAGFPIFIPTPGSGTVRILFISSDPIVDETTLFTITFNISPDATPGIIPLSLEVAPGGITGPDGLIPVNIVNGSIKVLPTILFGDINNDGEIDGADVTRLRRYIAGWDVEISLDASDVNGDGEIDGADVTRLRRYIAGWDAVLGT